MSARAPSLAERLSASPPAAKGAVSAGRVGFVRVRLNWMRAIRLSMEAMPSTSADDGYTVKSALAAASWLAPRPWASLQFGAQGVEVVGWRPLGSPKRRPTTDPRLEAAARGVLVDEAETPFRIEPGAHRWLLLANAVASPSVGPDGRRVGKNDVALGLSGAMMRHQYAQWARRRICRPGVSMPLVNEPGGPVMEYRELVRVTRKGSVTDLNRGRVGGKRLPEDDGRVALQHDAVRVVMSGTLTVEDPAALATLLLEGVGASKAFGCGMLMLDAQPGGLPALEALLPGAARLRKAAAGQARAA